MALPYYFICSSCSFHIAVKHKHLLCLQLFSPLCVSLWARRAINDVMDEDSLGSSPACCGDLELLEHIQNRTISQHLQAKREIALGENEEEGGRALQSV